MHFKNESLKIRFKNSKEEAQIDLQALVKGITDFLEHFAEAAVCGKHFCSVTGNGNGEKKFLRLLAAAKYQNDPKGFFSRLMEKLGKACGGNEKITVSGVGMPHLLLVSILEKIMPETGLVTIQDVHQLEKQLNMKVPKNKRNDLQKVIAAYPVRLSGHVIRQMRVSRHVACQYAPFVEELDETGHTDTWTGRFQQGLLEQMYQNRVIFLLSMNCPVYCRFCFRKHKASRKLPDPSTEDIHAAIRRVQKTPGIKEILISGGDPFMHSENLKLAIERICEIPHVQTLRIGTRSIAYYPELFLAHDFAWLNYLKQRNLMLQKNGKHMEVGVHFIHPDEISPQSLYIINELTKSGIKVYVQTPFLKNCNDTGPPLLKLFSLLRGAGCEIHYIFMPCSPVRGSRIYWTPISEGLSAAAFLRAHLSDRAMPKICTATSIGKIDWHQSGWAVEKDRENPDCIWIRTPYTLDYFNDFALANRDRQNIRVNDEGTLDIKFTAEIGDSSLFMGARPNPKYKRPKTLEKNIKNTNTTFIEDTIKDQRIRRSIVETESSTLFRQHETRVEIHAEDGHKHIDYIRKDRRITDIVISSKNDAVESLSLIIKIIQLITEIKHVNAVRLRSLKFNYAPHQYTPWALERLAYLSRGTLASPLRIEIETQFLNAGEILPEHERLARELKNRGITVYNNTPLLGTINDTPDEICRLAFRLRKAGIEFHHLYATGLPIQEAWNHKHPIDLSRLVDIASKIRRDGSGREIPGIIIQTLLGEVDFGLTSSFIYHGGRLYVRLKPYKIGYFKKMNPDFCWPKCVKTDLQGRPIIPVSGLKQSADFLFVPAKIKKNTLTLAGNSS